jgi:MFS family permease
VGALRHRDFRLLFVGQFVSLFGDGLFAVALSFAVLEATGSRADLGIVLAAGSLPLVAFVLVGGVWADRVSRRRLMLASDGLRMAIQGALAVLIGTGHATLWVFIGLYAIYGVAMAFFSPASTGLVPELLPADELRRANGLLGIARSVTAIAGAAVGGVLVDTIGPGTAIGADSATFAVSAIALALMHAGRTPSAAREPFLHELAVGWREVRSRPWVWMTILNVSLFLMLYVAPFDVIGPIVARESLGGATAWGLISASFAVGMALGGAVVIVVRLRRPVLVAGVLFGVTSFSPLLLAFTAPVALICTSYALEGIGVGIFVTTWDTVMQREIPAEVLSRVSAWDWMGSLAGMPLGFALTGPVIALAGEKHALYGMAACALGLTAWMLIAPDIRRIGAMGTATAAPAEA